MMIVDRQVLFVLSFNFTHLDIDRSRSFGIVAKARESALAEGRSMLYLEIRCILMARGAGWTSA